MGEVLGWFISIFFFWSVFGFGYYMENRKPLVLMSGPIAWFIEILFWYCHGRRK